MKILVTAFEPFNNENINSSLEVLNILPNKILNTEILKLTLPTVRYKSLEIINKYIDSTNAEVILMLGEAGGRANISIERVAINIDDFKIKDNEGNHPTDEIIIKDGKNAYFSNLPIKKINDAINNIDIPSNISNTAGTFVCNHIFYGVAHKIQNTDKQCGFIHIPFTPKQVVNKNNIPSMSTEISTKAIIKTIEIIIENYIK